MANPSRLKRKPRSQSKALSSSAAPRCRLFDEPNVLQGEDAAAYEELLARVRAAVNPIDIIEDMFVADVVALQWLVLRWRRLSSNLIQNRGGNALQRFLVAQFESNYALHQDHFQGYIAKILQTSLPEDQAAYAKMLAAECAAHTDEGDSKLDEVLRSIGLNTGSVLDDARSQRAKELVQGYLRREPDAVTFVHEILADNNVSMDSFMADALAEKLDYIERIDRLTAIAEERRNAMLTEIERRRAVFGETLRRNVEIEDAEFKEIEPTPKEK